MASVEISPSDKTAPVRLFKAQNGLRLYRIRHQALPHLIGYVHLILGDDGYPPTLLDTGSGEGESFSQIMAGLSAVRDQWGENFVPTDLRRILISHAHVDHFGGTYAMTRLTQAEVVSHPFDSRIISAFNERAALSNVDYADFLVRAGIEPDKIDSVLRSFGFLPGRFRSVPVDRLVKDGEELDGLIFHHFPGHSAGHLAVEVGEYLLSGDLILSKTLTQNWPETLFPYCGLGRYLESIRRLDAMAKSPRPPLILLPAHEEPIRGISPRIELILKAERRRNERLFAILDAAADPMTLNEIARVMYLTAHTDRLFFALCDVAARLEYLQLNAQIAVANYDEIKNGEKVFRYRRVM